VTVRVAFEKAGLGTSLMFCSSETKASKMNSD